MLRQFHCCLSKHCCKPELAQMKGYRFNKCTSRCLVSSFRNSSLRSKAHILAQSRDHTAEHVHLFAY